MRAFGIGPSWRGIFPARVTFLCRRGDCGTEKETSIKNVNFIMRICFGIGGGSVGLHGSV
jgi:hypothetical protein